MTRESEIEDYLIRRVKAAGGEIRKVKWIGRKNAPDRLVMLSDRPPTFVELKRPGEEPTDAQWREMNLMEDLGCAVTWMNCRGDVDDWMELWAGG